MFTKKPSPAVAHAYAETIRIFEEELDRLRDKIANDTITTDEQRLFDRVSRLRAEAIYDYLMYINKNVCSPKRFWRKVLNKAA